MHKNSSANPILLFLVLACIAMPQTGAITSSSLRVPPAIVLNISSAAEDEEYAQVEFNISTIGAPAENGKLIMVPSDVLKIPFHARDLWPGSGLRTFETMIFMN